VRVRVRFKVRFRALLTSMAHDILYPDPSQDGATDRADMTLILILGLLCGAVFVNKRLLFIATRFIDHSGYYICWR